MISSVTNKAGNNFDHRRTWLVDRIKFLSTVFSIDIAAYAIMSNHYHLVLKVNRDAALSLTNDEVIERWYQFYIMAVYWLTVIGLENNLIRDVLFVVYCLGLENQQALNSFFS
jgi:hypothetical protein